MLCAGAGECQLMREIAIENPTGKRSIGVGGAENQATSGAERSVAEVSDVEKFGLCQVLKEINGADDVVAGVMLPKELRYIALHDSSDSETVGKRHLLRASIYADDSFIAELLEGVNEGAIPAADLQDGSSSVCRKTVPYKRGPIPHVAREASEADIANLREVSRRIRTV